MNPVSELFDRMDKWRHFPNYQLERRADIFFSLYLPEVLEDKLDLPVRPELVPEFPVRIGTIYEHTETDKSYKIDYLALSATGTTSVFVELKTEGASRRDSQDKYLRASQEVGLPALLGGLCDIFRVTNAKRKYFALIRQLEQIGLLEIPQELTKIMEGKNLRDASAVSNRIRITAPTTKPHIVFVQPNQPDDDSPGDIITFQEFADVVARHPDAVSQRFAVSLREWARVQGGSWQGGRKP